MNEPKTKLERVVLWHRRVLRSAKDEVSAPNSAKPKAAQLSALPNASSWPRAVVARCLAGGAEVALQVSGTVVATFDPEELFDAVEIALDLADEAEDAGHAIAIAIAMGETEEGDTTAGPPFERAELLAFRAKETEVALDQAARTRAGGLFLFARQLAGAGTKGFVVDRTHPRRDAAGDAMARLGKIVVPSATAALRPHLLHALEGPRQTVALRGPPGAGAHELAELVANEASPPRRLLVLGSAPGGLVPLASLRTAFEGWPGGPPTEPTLAAVLRGELPDREALIAALGEELAKTPSLILFAPLSEVDAATLEIVALARDRSRATPMFARLGIDAGVPGILARSGELVELTLPLLRTSDAREVARGLLGEASDADLVRRVAVVGGDSALAVAEAARTFVSCGDLVLDGEAFVWRSTPRGGASATALDVLIAERFEMLDDESRRLLEAAAVLGEGTHEADLQAIAEKDGLRARAMARALSHLVSDAWLGRGGATPAIRFLSAYTRRFVVQALPPARRAELHRFASETRVPDADASLPATVLTGWHTLEGGREADGATKLLGAARMLAAAGWSLAAAHAARVARRGLVDPESMSEADLLSEPLAELAESSVEVDIPAFEPESDLHALPPDEVAAAPELDEAPPDLVAEVRAALRARDPEALDRIARRAVLEGSDMNAVARMRALADLLRGDIGSAARGLVRARARTGTMSLRALVAEAMVALRAGAVPAAIRLALRALLEARRTSDTRGEAVALFTLAASYRALGRESDAVRLEARAQG